MMYRVLFVCTANLYRSPLAAAFFSSRLRSEGQAAAWVVESAGTWTVPGRPVPAEVLKAGSALGLDLQPHRTRQVSEALLRQFDFVLVMAKGHREALGIEFPWLRAKIHLLAEVADRLEYSIADPVSSGMPINEIAMELCRLIEQGYSRICELAQAPETAPSHSRPHVNYTL